MNSILSRFRPEARAAILSIVVFWTFYFTIVTLRSFVAGYGDPWPMIPRRAAVVIVGAAICWFILFWLRPLEGRPFGLRMAAQFLAAVPASAAYAAVNYALFYIIAPLDFLQEMDPAKREEMDPWLMILESAISWFWFFSAWAAFYLALRYAEEVRQAERRVARWRAEAESAQLRALRYQVNPHFLFNTLNSLSALILRERLEEAERMVINLSRFLRTSLSDDPEQLVTLAEEVEQQRLYLDVEQVRFGDRLKIDIDIDPAAGRTLVPPMILQPLVENAVKHAVGPARSPVTIQIYARNRNGRIEICVSDDGSGDLDPLASGLGTGLANVRGRVFGHFGPDATFSAAPGDDSGFVVRMSWSVGQGQFHE